MTGKNPPAIPAVSAVSEPSSAWAGIAPMTGARVALGRSGISLPTREVLKLGLAHAQACDAVHIPLDVAALDAHLLADGWATVHVRSAAHDRHAYLARPDWGRRLDPESRDALGKLAEGGIDVVFVLSDGLSSVAVQRHAPTVMREFQLLAHDLRIAPMVIATQARVALADEVGELLGARVAISVIGERPGLSSPDSLGLYVTAAPRVGRSDADRNCISNIHGAGLSCERAAAELVSQVRAALTMGRSGIVAL